MQPTPIAYELIRSRRKTVSIEIRPTLQVVVRAPDRMPVRAIDAFVQGHAGWIEKHAARLRTLGEVAGPPLTPSEIAALKAAARAYLPGRTAYFSRLMGLVPAGIRITAAEKRFGSCSGQNRLCFSYHLMRYPPEAIDYVIVHELAHLTHRHHGPAFHALVAETLPDHRDRRALLRGPPARCSDLPPETVV